MALSHKPATITSSSIASSTNDQANESSARSRREFLKNSTVAAVGAGLASSLVAPRFVHAEEKKSDTLRIGLVGCGGRGTGAAINAMRADDNCKLVAMCDVFEDQLQKSHRGLEKSGGSKFDVPKDRCFTGFDGYQKLIESGVDVVILATSPHFRPEQFRACVEAGKHTFVEKPVAVDAPGIRSMMASNEIAKKKGLSVVSGLCWRYDYGVRETMKRILDGAIGDVVAVETDYLGKTPWHRGKAKDWERWGGFDAFEYQMRNWPFYTWLSGDFNTEQHVHSLDKASWLMGDVAPLRAYGMGGRQQRVHPKYGHIYDHFSVVYEFAGGRRAYSNCRQQQGTSPGFKAQGVDEFVMGTKGRAYVLKHRIWSGKDRWAYKGAKPGMYQVEHNELFESVRQGEPINNGDYMCRGTMMAILGRMCAYTGQTINWDDCLNDDTRLGPETYDMSGVGVPCEVAIPGDV